MSNKLPQPSHDASEHRLYLLRLTRNEPQEMWRIALQTNVGDPPKLFANLDELYEFLQEIVESN